MLFSLDDTSALGYALANREGDSLTIVGHGLGIEAGTSVAHEEAERCLFHFGVDRDQLRARPAGGVDRCFASRGHQGRDALVTDAIADHDELNANAVIVLDLVLKRAQVTEEAALRLPSPRG